MLDGQGNDMENKTFNIGDIVKDIWAGRLAIVVEVCEPWTWDDEGLDFHGDKGLKLCRFGNSRTFYAPQDTWETEIICQESVKSGPTSLRQPSQRVTL